jgi:hypothetical protein
MIQLRVSPEMKALAEQLARENNRSLANYIESLLLEKATTEQKKRLISPP